ncbi:hypothetical protein CR513_13832, partial [Mucuna pruriens]
MVRSMKSNAKLPQFLWIEALKMAILKTPFELLKGWKPSLLHIHVWGCLFEVRICNPQEKKLDPRTIIRVIGFKTLLMKKIIVRLNPLDQVIE